MNGGNKSFEPLIARLAVIIAIVDLLRYGRKAKYSKYKVKVNFVNLFPGQLPVIGSHLLAS